MPLVTVECDVRLGTQNSGRLLQMHTNIDRQYLASEAKAIVALAFRNGPIEDIHAGRLCPTCAGQAGYSRISDAEMKLIMTNAVDQVYALLLLRIESPEEYESRIRQGERYTAKWDEPRVLRRNAG